MGSTAIDGRTLRLKKGVRLHQGAWRVPKTDAADGWVAIARRGAAKKAANRSDEGDFTAMFEFIGSCLAARDEAALVDLESQLRSLDRDALSWYLWLARTHAGTIYREGMFHHLILIPVIVSAPVPVGLSLGPDALQIGSLLELALDLGPGSVQLCEHAVPLDTLECMSLTKWRAMALSAGEPVLGHQPLPLAPAGAFVGRWSVPEHDERRLMRKLSHALQPSTAVDNWRTHTEAVLKAQTGAQRVKVLPTMLLQDVFRDLRRFILVSSVEAVCRVGATRLEWCWSENSSELCWSVCDERAGTSQAGKMRFPDEPWTAIANQLRYVAHRFCLSLHPTVR